MEWMYEYGRLIFDPLLTGFDPIDVVKFIDYYVVMVFGEGDKIKL